MPLNATTSLPLPRADPEAMRTTGGSEATALPDTATAAQATQASLSIQRMAIHRGRSAKPWMWLATCLGFLPIAILALLPANCAGTRAAS